MNTHKPLLSDNALYGRRNKAGRQVPLSGLEVRDYYERLIAEGKLRVVVEVGNVSAYPGDFQCSGCGCKMYETYSDHVVDRELVYCPGCGNPIKR